MVNIHASTEEKEKVKNGFYENLEIVTNFNILRSLVKIVLGDAYTKVEREDLQNDYGRRE